MIHGPWIANAIDTYLAGKTIKALAVTSAHIANTDTLYRSSITGEVVGGGYTPGGVVVTGVLVTWDSTADRIKITCNTVDFGAVTTSDVGGVVFYISTGNATTDRVLWTDTFAPVAADGSLTWTPNSDGAMWISTMWVA